MGAPDSLLLERATRVRLLVLDVDGVLTDGRLWFDSAGNELKAFHTRDGLGLKALRECGYELALISGRASRMVTERAATLEIRHVYQGREHKLAAWEHLLAATGIPPEAVCYMGDDWVDLPCLRRAGLAVTVPEAPPAVRAVAHWITRLAGGTGAVRELCELLLESRGLLPKALAPYGDP